MRTFLKLGLVVLLAASVALGSYEASAKVKLKVKDDIVLSIDNDAILSASVVEQVNLVLPNFSSGKLPISGDRKSPALHAAFIFELRRETYGGRYLHRSQAWLKRNNLQMNGASLTFGVSTEVGSPMLC